jgi:hypothetical protein
LDELKPIDKAIIPKKQQQWHYKIHPYFTKQASNVVRTYIEHFFDASGIGIPEAICIGIS